MARITGRLTALRVERAKPGLHHDGEGLYLQVSEGGRSWLFRFMLDKRPRWMGLGPCSLYSLAEARALAHDARRLRHQGIDPIEARRATKAQARLDAAKAITFQQCGDSYIKERRSGWRNSKHAAQWETTVRTYVYPVIGSLPVQKIDTLLVLKVLKQHVKAERREHAGEFWQVRSTTAARLRGRIEAVLDWAKAHEYRQGENPARWRGHLDKLLPVRSRLEVRHHPALPYRELPGFMADLRRRNGTSARALEFTIATAGRAGEVIGARWLEIDLVQKVWTVPAERMKSGKTHRVPLSTSALAVLREMQALRPSGDADAYVFPGRKPGRPLDKMAMTELLERMGCRGDVTVHGFRSTFRDWAAERTNYPNHVVEQALAHTIGSAVERAYRRSDLYDKRRRLMDAWATFCATESTAHDKVVSLQGR
jgi:integrase